MTRNGVPAIWMIADADFESIMETLDVLADAAAMRDVATSQADAQEGRYVTAAACWEFIHGPLAENPYRVGKPLLEPLAPQYSARRGEYRVLYLIEDVQVTIVITSVTHQADAYRMR